MLTITILRHTNMRITYAKKIDNIAKYPFSLVDEQLSKLKKQRIQVIDFGVGDPTIPTPAFIINHLATSAHNRAQSGYPNYIGELSYRASCASYLSREYGINLDPETEISSTLGSKEAIFHFPAAFIDPGDLVICPTPAYPVYKTGTHFAGGNVYFTPLKEENNFLIDLESIPKSICAKAKIIWTNYPNSPTGVMAPKTWLHKLVIWAREHNIIIAADEGCYNDLYTSNKPTSILQVAKEGILAFYSLSKRSNMTGYRVGFVAGDKNIITGFRRLKSNIDSGTPTFIQDAASRALDDVTEISKMRSDYAEKRSILVSALNNRGLPTSTSNSTFYLWQKCAIGSTGRAFSNALMKIGLITTPGEILSDITTGGFNPASQFVRFALVPQMKDIKEAARRIKTDLIL
jgi:LL-diaminopimelate aminotransferase